MSNIILTVTNDSGDSAIIDLYQNESIGLTFRFTDIAELGVTGSFSKQFRVPATETNVAFFGPLFDPNYSGSFSFKKKIAATISVDTLPVSQGHIQMKNIYRQAGKISDFEIIFFAETPDLARALEGLKLADLDYTSINHDITYANVTTGSAGEWLWALTDRGQRWSQLGEAGTRPVLSTSIPVYPGDLTPCVNWKWLMDKIITEAGFTYNDAELDSDIEISVKWMPYLISRYVNSGVPPQAYLFSLGYATTSTGYTFTGTANSLVLSGLTEVYDNGGTVASSIFTAPFTGYFTFSGWATIDPTTGITTEQVALRFVDPANGNAPYWGMVPGPITGNDPQNFQTGNVTILLNQNDQVQFAVAGSNGWTAQLIGDGADDPATGTGWRLVSNSAPLAGDPIDFALNAPDMTQMDFIRDTIKMHNLAVVPDRNVPRKLRFVPMVNYLGTGSTKDWTNKLDTDKDETLRYLTDEQRARLVWTYKAGSEALSQFFVREANRVYGDLQIDGYTVSDTQEANEFATGEQRVELVCASTPCNPINGTSIPIPKFINESGEFQVPGPRILYNSGTAEIALFDEVGGSASITTVQLINHYSQTVPSFDDNDLNFWSETPLQFITASPYGNLFNKWWRSYMNELYADDARYYEAYFALSLTDVLTFQFSDKIWIKDSYWRILEIVDYNIGGFDSTLVKFIKIVDVQLDCTYVPVSVTTAGIVNFEDVDGNPSFGDQACCERYGYSWDGTAGRCRAFGGGRDPNQAYDNGTSGNGYSFSQGMNVLTPFSSVFTTGSDINPDTVLSAIYGYRHSVASGNPFSLIAGDTINVTGANRGVAAVGKNAKINHPGFHVGGGWYDDDRDDASGRAQFGVIQLIGEGDFTNNTTDVWLYVEGVNGNYIEMLNNTSWAAIITVCVHKWNAATSQITGISWGFFGVSMYKTANVAQTDTVYTIHQNGSLGGTLNLLIDDTTNTAQHRFSVRYNGGNPHNNCRVTATIKYTQVAE